jgi:DNA polymerase-3 subunit gamma/tau
VVQLARLLAAQDIGALLDYARAMEQFSPDYTALLDELNSLLARIALFQAVGKPYDDEDDVPAEVMAELASAIPAADLQLYWQVGVLGRRDLPLATDPRAAFALVLLRMLAFRPGGDQAGSVAAPASRSPAPRVMNPAVSREAAGLRVDMGAGAEASAGAGAAAVAAALPLDAAHWKAIVQQLGLTGLAAQFAANCAMVAREGAQVRLLLDARSVSMRNRATEEKLTAALSRHVGSPVRLLIEVGTPDAAPVTPARERDQQADARLARARELLESDPNIQALRTEMGATIFPDSIRAISNEEG